MLLEAFLGPQIAQKSFLEGHRKTSKTGFPKKLTQAPKRTAFGAPHGAQGAT